MLRLHDLTYRELEVALTARQIRAVHAAPLWSALHRQAETNLRARKDFPPPLQRWLEGPEATSIRLDEPEEATFTASSDGKTRKYLLRLEDAQEIETVLMGYPGRFTACLSTQAGCAMGCVFCATGQMGYARHLRPGEIVAQVLHVQRELTQRGERLRNLVLMGMGEPLHNYDSVMKALEILCDPRGSNITASRVTVNTVGVVPGILRLAQEKRPYHLGVSLHGATEEERSALVPVSKRWPLRELIAACRAYCDSTGKHVFFAWTLIAGVNDSPEHAARLIELLRGVAAHVNLIPLNETRGYDGRESSTSSAFTFRAHLQGAGIPCTIRQRRGIDVDAGCGQLTAARRQRQRVR